MNPVDNICTQQTVFNTKNKEFKIPQEYDSYGPQT